MRIRAFALLALLAACGDEAPEPQPTPRAFDVATDPIRLSDDVQRYVWDIEEYAHFLQMEWWPVLKAALKGGEHGFFAPDFTAAVPAGEPDVLTHGPVRVETFDVTKTRDVDAAAFLARLGRDHTIAEFHVDDLSPVVRGDFEGPWTGTWSISLRRPGRDHRWRFRVHYELMPKRPAGAKGFVKRVETLAEQRVTAAQPLFEDITAKSGILTDLLTDTWKKNRPTVFHGAFLLDYDRDDNLDVFLADEPHSYLYRGRGDGTFEDVSIDAHVLAPPSGSFAAATVADLDNDGYEDLILQVKDGREHHSVIYRNETDGTFRPLARNETNFPRKAIGYAAVGDYDRDGLVDLYYANAGPRPPNREEKARWIGDRSGPQGLLLRNRGGFRFEDVTEAAGARGGNREILGSLWVDLEPDGDPDLVLVNHMGENALLVNRGDGTFEERAFARTFGGFSMGVAAGDLDGDADVDLYVANMSSRAGHRIVTNLRPEDYPPGVHALMYGWIDGNELMENTGDGLKVTALHTSGWAYGPTLIDIDGDGRLDVYCPAGYQSVDPRQPDG